MRCVAIVSGAVVDVDPQPSDISTCTLVLVDPSDITANPFVLTRADFDAIAPGLWLLLVTGFIFRWLIRALS